MKISKLSQIILDQADIEQIISLWQAAGLSHRPKGRDTKENIARQMHEENTKFIGLRDDEQLIAVAIASHNGRKGWINRLAVHPEYRRKGIATRMINICEDWLHIEGIGITAVLIEADNPDSMSLFNKNGYTRHDDIIYFTKKQNKDV